MAGRDDVGTARYLTEVDASGLAKGLTDAERKIKQTGRATEDAFARQGTAAVGRFTTTFNGLLAKIDGVSRRGGIGAALMGGIGLGAGLGAFGVVQGALGGVVSGINDAIDAASDLAESQSKVGVVFGESAGQIERWSDSAATAMGLSKQAALEAAGTFGNLFDALGLTEDATVEMSKGAVQLAADLASFNNADTEETLLAIRSGLLGEAEPMRKFGSALSAARVESFALAQGWVKNKADLTEAMKVQARYKLILQDTVNAQGDFARTADGMANKGRIAAAKSKDLAAEVGGLLAPLGSLGTDVGIAAVDVVRSLGEAFSDMASPTAAATRKLEEAVLELADKYGILAEVQAELDRRAGARQTLEQDRRLTEAQTAAVDARTRALKTAADTEAQYTAEIIRETGAMADGIVTAQEQADLNRLIYQRMLDNNFVIDEQTGKWIDYNDEVIRAETALAELTRSQEEAARTGNLNALYLAQWGDAAGDAADKVPAAMKAITAIVAEATNRGKTDLGAFADLVTAEFERVPTKVKGKFKLRPVIHHELTEVRQEAKLRMKEINHLLANPDDRDKMEKELRRQIRKGRAAMKEALRTGNASAYNEAKLFVEETQAKLKELTDEDWVFGVRMVIGKTKNLNEGSAVGSSSWIDSMIQNGTIPIPGRDSGGPVRKGWPYIVGERRPEVFVPESNGRILPDVGTLGGGTRTVRHTGTVEVRLSRDSIAAARSQGASWGDIGRIAGAAAALIAHPADVLTPMEPW